MTSPPSPTAAADGARADLVDALLAVGREDRSAFARLYRLTSAKLFGICLRICGERAAAEDVLSEVYLTVWRRAGAFEPGRASPITWLATIARNRAIDWVRAAPGRRRAPLDEALDLPDDRPDPETAALTADRVHQLRDCLDELDPRSRDAIRTAFFNGQTYAELAERAGVPLGTMKSVVRRGLARLRNCLDD